MLLENAYFLARNALVAIVRDDECRCGNPPYDNGNPCSACFALQILERLPEKPGEEPPVEYEEPGFYGPAPLDTQVATYGEWAALAPPQWDADEEEGGHEKRFRTWPETSQVPSRAGMLSANEGRESRLDACNNLPH